MYEKKRIACGVVVIILLSFTIPFMESGHKAKAESDEAFILLYCEDAECMNDAILFIGEKGGSVMHSFPFHVLIGNLSSSLAGEVAGQRGILSVHYDVIDVSTIGQYGDAAVAAANYWNSRFQPPVYEAQEKEFTPLINDALTVPTQKLLEQPFGSIGPPYGTAYGAQFWDTSEYMIGTFSVNVILVESKTSSSENWFNVGSCTPPSESCRESQVTSEIIDALDWWADWNANAHLNFYYYFYYGRTDARAQTIYEPISMSSDTYWPTDPGTGGGLWVNEIMNNFGYTTGSRWEKVRNFDNETRNGGPSGTNPKTDWAFTIFVVDSLNDDGMYDGRFSDGKFAYAWVGGPYLVMTYDNATWGIEDMDLVTAHEMGHIFYADDQYGGSGSSCYDYSGYLNVRNGNYVLSCLMNQPTSIMRSSTWPITSNTVDPYARGQIGWGNVGSGTGSSPKIGDTDQDGVSNIIDLPPTITLNAYTPDPTTDNTPRYTGNALTTATIPNYNPVPHFDTHHAIQTNKITNVQYRVDGGTWIDALPLLPDTAFDEYNEDYTFTTNTLSPGQHTIEARSQNTAGNWSTIIASDTLTIQGKPTDPVLIHPESNQNPTCPLTELSFDWEDSWGSTPITYQIQIDDESGFNSPFIADVSGLTVSNYTYNGTLTASTQYFWRVMASNSYGDSAWSSRSFSTGECLPPSQAPALQYPQDDATDVCPTTGLTFDWEDVTGYPPITYEIEVATDDQFISMVFDQSGITSSQYTYHGTLLELTQYFWHVNVTDINGTSDWSETWDFTMGEQCISTLYIPFVVDTTDFRSNIGISNPNSTSANVTVEFYTNDGTLNASRIWNVPKNGYTPIVHIIREVRNLGETSPTNLQGYLRLISDMPIYVFGGLIDNTSNDPSFAIGMNPINNGLSPSILKAGVWSSQVVFTNRGTSVANITLASYPLNGGDTPAATSDIQIDPGKQWRQDDMITYLGLPVGYQGSLVWTTNQPLLVYVRGWTINRTGQMYPVYVI